jgi:hypothetical protein
MERAWLSFEEVGDIDVPEGNDADAGAIGDESGERVEVRFMTVGRNDDELADTVFFPRSEQLVDCTVQGLLAQGSRAGILSFGRNVDAVVHGRSAEHTELSGEINGDPACDEDVASEWKVRPVLFHGADGYDQARIAREVCCCIDPAELVECQ